MLRTRVTKGTIQEGDRVYIYYDGWVKHVIGVGDAFIGDNVGMVDIVYRMMSADDAKKNGFPQAKKYDFRM